MDLSSEVVQGTLIIRKWFYVEQTAVFTHCDPKDQSAKVRWVTLYKDEIPRVVVSMG